MAHNAPGVTRILVSTLITTSPAMLYGVTVWASGAAGRASMYNARSAVQADVRFTVVGEANVSRPLLFPFPVPFGNGIFVFVASITEVAIFWRPMTPEEAEEYL